MKRLSKAKGSALVAVIIFVHMKHKNQVVTSLLFIFSFDFYSAINRSSYTKIMTKIHDFSLRPRLKIYPQNAVVW